MPQREVGEIADALIVFADIVDSSNYSAILTYREYAERLLEFQETFCELGRRYFPPPCDKAVEFSRVAARGDEGTVFVTCPRHAEQDTRAGMVFRAIEFLYHLKGRLRYGIDRDESLAAPRRFDVGAGIHWGPVALMLSRTDHRKPITGIEGFAINYAKRVESCSRDGRHSRILLSSAAASALEFQPVLLSRLRGTMKGIEDDVELFEVRAGLFDDMALLTTDEQDQRLIEEAENLSANPAEIDAPWQKCFVISVLERVSSEAVVQPERDIHRHQQYGLAWHSPKEDDPILLYLRSRDCRESGERTREVRYLRHLIDQYPDFVHARLSLVKACWALARNKAEPEERLFARDTAKEFLDRYDSFLRDEEKRELKQLLIDLAPRSRKAKGKSHSKGG